MAADGPPKSDAPPPKSDAAPPPPKDAKADKPKAPELEPEDPPADSEPINMEIFGQILELDEDDTFEFSKEMVEAYFSQATTTFDDMDNALGEKELLKLSELGHFLKGSSAALGIHRVQAACEKMQHYGELRDEEAKKDLTPAVALERIDGLISEVKTEYADAEKWLKKWYRDKKVPFADDEAAS